MNLNIKATVVIFTIGTYFLFTGCQKDAATAKAPSPVAAINASPILIQAIQDARTNMAARLSSNDYSDLDWANATARKSSEEETTVNVKSKTDPTVMLTYVTGTNMKLYKWEQEVHFIVN